MNESLKDKLFPPTNDLSAAIRFDSETGTIWLEQQRMLLTHASALGSMRHELIQSLGKDYARDVLMRMGWASAQSDAEMAKRIRAGQDPMKIFSVGPQLHTIEGVVKVDPVKVEIDIEKGQFYGEFIWSNSFEADEHVRLLGSSDDPVCWHLLGYASGYTSNFMGIPVIYKEVDCIGKGDHQCRIIGKPLDEWEDADELSKFFDSEPLVEKLNNLQTEVQQLRTVAAFAMGLDPEEIVANSPAIRETMYLLDKAAETDVSVLMLGDTGVGKEVFSQALHRSGNRKDEAFVAINCAALPTELIEAELFGAEKGSYTGADKMRIGRFERADGGTLFLDELAELSEPAQAKLLRVLQSGEFERVGGNKTIKVDVRLIAATNVDLDERVRQGKFRADLFYRLNVFPITIPPLRDRLADLPELVAKFVKKLNRKYGKKVIGVTDECLARFRSHDWPGNIRELENILERGVILTQNNHHIESNLICINMPGSPLDSMVIGSDGSLEQSAGSAPAGLSAGEDLSLLLEKISADGLSLDQVEQQLLSSALDRSQGNVEAAARLLGISGPQCRYRLKKFNLV